MPAWATVEVVAPLQALIEDAEPLRLGLHADAWKSRWDDLWKRWAALREPLAAFAATHPSQEIAKTVAEISKAVPKALSDAGWFLGGFYAHPQRAEGSAEAQAGAVASHERAVELGDQLLAEIRAFGGS